MIWFHRQRPDGCQLHLIGIPPSSKLTRWSVSLHCRVHLGHTYHTYTQTLHSAMSRQPSLLPVATTSSLTARYVAHTLERLLAYTVVVDRPFRRTHGRTPARIRRRCEVTNALYHCTAASENSRPRSLPHSNCG